MDVPFPVPFSENGSELILDERGRCSIRIPRHKFQRKGSRELGTRLFAFFSELLLSFKLFCRSLLISSTKVTAEITSES